MTLIVHICPYGDTNNICNASESHYVMLKYNLTMESILNPKRKKKSNYNQNLHYIHEEIRLKVTIVIQ